MSRTVTMVASWVLAVCAMAEDISYSDGQSHDFSAQGSGTHVGSITLSGGSKLNVTAGELNVDTSSIKASDVNTTLTVKEGARLLCEPAAADSVVFQNGASLVIDGGEMIGPATTTQPPTTGAIRLGNNNAYSTGGGGSLRVTNGGKLTVDRGSVAANSSMLFVSGMGSSVLFDGGSTVTFGDEKNWTYPICMGSCSSSMFTVREATFNFTYFRLGGAMSKKIPCHDSEILFENAKVSGVSVVIFGLANTSGDVSSGNTLTISGDQSDVSFGYNSSQDDADAHDNHFVFAGGKYTGGVTLGGYENSFEVTGGVYEGKQQLLLTGGHDNRFVQTGGETRLQVLNNTTCPVLLGGSNNCIYVLGGSFTSGQGGTSGFHPPSLTFNSDADGCQAVFSNCVAHLQTYGWYGQSVVFNAGAKNSAIVVEQDGVLNLYGQNNFGGAACENCALEFRGSNPQMRLTFEYWMQPTTRVIFGSDDAAMDGKTVALRFVLPSAPYADAPIHNDNTLSAVKLCANAKIVVKEGSWTKGKKKLFYPLIYDNKGFNGELDDGQVIASLNAHAELPESAVLEYHATDNVVGVKMPNVPSGLSVLIR